MSADLITTTSMTPPTLVSPTFGGPDALDETLERLGYGQSLGALSTFNEVLLKRAEVWIEGVTERGRGPQPDARLLRVLVQRLPDQEAKAVRSEIVRQALGRRHRVGWRHLWLLWEHASEARRDVAPALAEMVEAAANRRPRLRASLPPWLGARASRMEAALVEPVHFIIGWILKERVSLEEINRKLGCSPSSEVGREIMLELASRSPADWWSGLTLTQKFSWAERGGLALIQAVAERELGALGARAGGRERVAMIKGHAELKTWVDRLLGTPSARPGAWAGLTSRARAVRGWLDAPQSR